MAGNPIQRKEIITPDAEKAIPDLIIQLNKLQAEFKELKAILPGSIGNVGDVQKLNTAQEKRVKSTQQLTKVQREQKNVIAEATKLEKERERNLAKQEILTTKAAKTTEKLRQATQKRNTELRKEVKLEGAAKDSLIAMEARLSKLRQEFAKTSAATRGKLVPAIQKLDKEVKKTRSSLGQFQGNVGNYRSALSRLKTGFAATALAITGVIAVARRIGRVFVKTIQIYSGFSKEMSKVGAVSGASARQMIELEAKAKKLGETTMFTAQNVAELQTQMAKLGLTADQINATTEAVVNLAIAADADLGRSAEVATKTMKAFGLQAEDIERITDTMASSFSGSALDMEKFAVSMANVAPVAKSAGKNIEETTAMLSILVDRGIDASKAGTDLRNIFLELSKQGLTWEEAMGKINTAADKNAVALELFGKRASTSAILFAENSKELERLTDRYSSAAGATRDMAKAMQDNLAGDAKAAKSAVQALAIAIGERLNNTLRILTKGFTNVVRGMANFIGKSDEIGDAIREEATQVNILVARITTLGISREDEIAAIDELNRIAPQLLENQDKENINYKKLKISLDDYNKGLTDTIILATLDNEQKEKAVKIAEDRLEAGNLESDLLDQIKNINPEIATSQATLNKKWFDATRQQQKYVRGLKDNLIATGQLNDGTQSFEKDALRKAETTLGNLQVAWGNYKTAQNAVNKGQGEANELTQKQAELMKILGIETEKVVEVVAGDGDDDPKGAVGAYNALTASITKLNAALLNTIAIGGDVSDIINKLIPAQQEVDRINATAAAWEEVMQILSGDEVFDEDVIEEIAQVMPGEEELTWTQRIFKEWGDGLKGVFQKAEEFDTSGKKWYHSLGFSEGDFKILRSTIGQMTAEVLSFFEGLASARSDLAETNFNIANQELGDLQKELEIQIALKEDGSAAEIKNLQDQVAEQKRIQQGATNDLREAKDAQIRIQKAQQIQSLITAGANTLEAATAAGGPIGWVIGLAALASLLIGFATFSSDASKLEEGGVGDDTGIIGGKRHSQGGERFGDNIEVEAGEAWGVLNRGATSKYGKTFFDMTNEMNRGVFDPELFDLNFKYQMKRESPILINNDNKKLEAKLSEMITEQEMTRRFIGRIKNVFPSKSGGFEAESLDGLSRRSRG